jgi:hypothetical protein
MLNKFLNFIKNNKIFCFVILVNIIQYIIRFHYDLFGADEIWSSEIMQYGYSISSPDYNNFHSIFSNNLGYGGGFWYIGHLIYIVTPFNFLATLKFISYLSMILSIVWIYLLLDKLNNNEKKLSFLTITTLPAFIYGIVLDKMITAENFVVNLSLLSLLISKNAKNKNSFYKSFFILGFATGLKINFITSSILLSLFLLYDYNKLFQLRLNDIFKIGIFGICGFLICNPLFLFNIKLFFANLPTRYHSSLKAVLNNTFRLHLVSLTSLILAFIYITVKNYKIGFLFVVFNLLSLLIATRTYTYYWHIVPLIIITIIALYKANSNNTCNKQIKLLYLILFLIICNNFNYSSVELMYLRMKPIFSNHNNLSQDVNIDKNIKYNYIFHSENSENALFNKNKEKFIKSSNYNKAKNFYDIKYLIYPLHNEVAHIFWRNKEVKEKLLEDFKNEKKINLLYVLYPETQNGVFLKDEKWLDEKFNYCKKLDKKIINSNGFKFISYNCN